MAAKLILCKLLLFYSHDWTLTIYSIIKGPSKGQEGSPFSGSVGRGPGLSRCFISTISTIQPSHPRPQLLTPLPVRYNYNIQINRFYLDVCTTAQSHKLVCMKSISNYSFEVYFQSSVKLCCLREYYRHFPSRLVNNKVFQIFRDLVSSDPVLR